MEEPLLYLEALDHDVTITPDEYARLKENLARRLDELKAALEVSPPAPGDSATAQERRREAAQRVNRYVGTLTDDWQRFARVPVLLAERLKRTSRWATHPRPLQRAVERAAELRGSP